MSRTAGFIAASMACAACSFLVETSGLGGPELPGPDASSSDAGSDAARDALLDADAGPAPCDALFCDDFERPAGDVRGAWTEALTNAGGALAIAPGQGTNGSSALRIRVPSSEGEAVRANLSKEVGSTKNVRFSFAMRVDVATEREVHLAEVVGENHSRGVFLFIAPGGQLKAAFQVYEGAGTYYDRDLPGFQAGLAQRYEIDVTPGSVPRAIVRIDGVDVVGEDLTFPIQSCSQVDLGASFARAGGAVDVFYDDVRVDVGK